MTDVCIIGPVSIENAHLFDSSSYSFSNSASRIVTPGATIIKRGNFDESYAFKIICTNDEALQLKGVVEQGEIIWMNTSDLTDNDYLQHKGWVILTELSMSEENDFLVECTISYVKVSDYENEYLTMDYSRGIYDGINIEPSYEIVNTITYLDEEPIVDSTTNWSTYRRAYVKGGNGTASFAYDAGNAELDLGITASVDGVYNWAYVICDTHTFTFPFTLEFTMDYNATRTVATAGSMGIGLSKNNYGNLSGYFASKRSDWLEFYWDVQGGSYFGSRTKKNSKTTINNIVRAIDSSPPANKSCRVKVEFEANGKMRVYYDIGVTGNYIQKYYGASNLPTTKNLYLYLWTANKDKDSAFVGSYRDIIIYYDKEVISFDNIVMMPPDATLQTTASGSRTVEDGTSYYYKNPTTELRYMIDKTKYYQGSVKLLSTNNDDTASRQVFSTGIKLTPTTTTLKNGLTQLTFDADEVIVSGWDSGAYHEVNRFDMGTAINLIKPVFINSERVVLQINDTKWTMLRSSPIVTVEHPVTSMAYVLRDTHYHDGGTVGSPFAAAADVTMTDANSGYYAKAYDSGTDTYQLLIVKKDQTTIKSDSLPADEVTGIGWFLKTWSGDNAADKLAQQWYKQTRTGISLKQII